MRCVTRYRRNSRQMVKNVTQTKRICNLWVCSYYFTVIDLSEWVFPCELPWPTIFFTGFPILFFYTIPIFIETFAMTVWFFGKSHNTCEEIFYSFVVEFIAMSTVLKVGLAKIFLATIYVFIPRVIQRLRDVLTTLSIMGQILS